MTCACDINLISQWYLFGAFSIFVGLLRKRVLLKHIKKYYKAVLFKRNNIKPFQNNNNIHM